MLKVTCDTCILIDYLNKSRIVLYELINNPDIELHITETVLSEIIIPMQRASIEILIKDNILKVLPEPKEGFSFPLGFPLLFNYQEEREKAIDRLLHRRRGKTRIDIINDFKIAEAHIQNNNDYLFTNNTKDFYTNLDIKILDYKNIHAILINNYNTF
jgi:hypothetical protein